MLNFVLQVCFLSSTKGSLLGTRAYLALYLVGPPSQETDTSPLSCLLLENRLCTSVKPVLSQFLGVLRKIRETLEPVKKRWWLGGRAVV